MSALPKWNKNLFRVDYGALNFVDYPPYAKENELTYAEEVLSHYKNKKVAKQLRWGLIVNMEVPKLNKLTKKLRITEAHKVIIRYYRRKEYSRRIQAFIRQQENLEREAQTDLNAAQSSYLQAENRQLERKLELQEEQARQLVQKLELRDEQVRYLEQMLKTFDEYGIYETAYKAHMESFKATLAAEENGQEVNPANPVMNVGELHHALHDDPQPSQSIEIVIPPEFY